MSEREFMEYDVVIVGAGPGGLAAAIRLKQLAAQQNRELSVCVLEKGSEPGAHILSGAIMDPRALTELIPDWKEKGAPLNQPVTRDQILFLSEKSATATRSSSTACTTRQHIVSLAMWCAGWRRPSAGGGNIPGFAAAEVLYDDNGAVRGVATGDMGLTSMAT